MMSIVPIARPAPLTRQPMLPSSDTYERPARLAWSSTASSSSVSRRASHSGWRISALSSKVDLGVERDHAAAGGDDERVDLEDRAVLGEEAAVERVEELGEALHRLLAGRPRPRAKRELARLEGREAEHRVDVEGDDLLRVVARRPLRCPCRPRSRPSPRCGGGRDRRGARGRARARWRRPCST